MAGESRSGEWFQIFILAGFFTAVGFALVAGVLHYFMTPSVAEQVELEAKNYERLTNLLDSKEMKALRYAAKTSTGEEGSKDLVRIINDSVTAYALSYSSFPRESEKPMGSSIEVTQKVVLNPAPLNSILSFVVRVVESKKSIRVSSFNVRQESRGRGARAAPESGTKTNWIATIEFVEFRAKGA